MQKYYVAFVKFSSGCFCKIFLLVIHVTVSINLPLLHSFGSESIIIKLFCHSLVCVWAFF